MRALTDMAAVVAFFCESKKLMLQSRIMLHCDSISSFLLLNVSKKNQYTDLVTLTHAITLSFTGSTREGFTGRTWEGI